MRILIEKEVPLINVDSDVLEMLDEGNIHYRSEPDGTTTIVEQKVNLLEEDMNDTSYMYYIGIPIVESPYRCTVMVGTI
jgi:hypothetical protein